MAAEAETGHIGAGETTGIAGSAGTHDSSRRVGIVETNSAGSSIENGSRDTSEAVSIEWIASGTGD